MIIFIILMKKIIDNIEKKIIDELSHRENFIFESKVLDVGDIHICDTSDNILFIIERKTISDLLSSIKDGRYSEQSLRLSSHKLSNHNIHYLIEGSITKYQDENLIYSTMCSLTYFKGFSLLRSNSVKETCDILIAFLKKMKRESEKGKDCYYSNTDNSNTDNSNTDNSDYCSTIKTTKKENITPENILQLMLMQIPRINYKTASAIANKYTNISNLLNIIQNNKTELYNVKILNEKTQKTRRINKNAIDNMCNFLC